MVIWTHPITFQLLFPLNHKSNYFSSRWAREQLAVRFACQVPQRAGCGDRLLFMGETQRISMGRESIFWCQAQKIRVEGGGLLRLTGRGEIVAPTPGTLGVQRGWLGFQGGRAGWFRRDSGDKVMVVFSRISWHAGRLYSILYPIYRGLGLSRWMPCWFKKRCLPQL